MSGHDLEVSIVIDLNIGGSGRTGGSECNGGVWADIAKQTVPVPGCLPLESGPLVGVLRYGERMVTYHVPDALRGNGEDAGQQGAGNEGASHDEKRSQVGEISTRGTRSYTLGSRLHCR